MALLPNTAALLDKELRTEFLSREHGSGHSGDSFFGNLSASEDAGTHAARAAAAAADPGLDRQHGSNGCAASREAGAAAGLARLSGRIRRRIFDGAMAFRRVSPGGMREMQSEWQGRALCGGGSQC